MTTIGSRLQNERQRIGLDKKDFAVLMGISRVTENAYEKGTRFPSVQYLIRAASKGVDIELVLIAKPKLRLPSTDQALIDQFRTLSEHNKRYLCGFMNSNKHTQLVMPIGHADQCCLHSRLRAERKRQKLTQEFVASGACITRATQIHYEQGSRLPDARYLAKIACLGMDVHYILFGTASPHFFDDRENLLLTQFHVKQKNSGGVV